MRILYINHYAGSPGYGMEYRPHYMARHWVAMGHDVTVVAASASHVRSRAPAMPAAIVEEMVEGVRHIWLKTPSYSGNGARRAMNMACFVARVYEHRATLRQRFLPDVVIASSTYTWDIFPARAIARRAGAKLIYEVHDLWPLSPIELGGMSRWHPFILSLQAGEDYACRHADLIVSMLPHADAHLREHGMHKDKFHYIPNGIELSEWKAGAGVLPEAHAALLNRLRAEGRFVVCYAGAHGVANAIECLVEAGAMLAQTNASIVLVGTGPEKRAVQQLAIERQAANVHFLDPLPKAAVPQFLRNCDATFIGLQKQPLFRFGISPNKLMDYMAAGKPIINAIEAGNDPVADAGCGFSVPAGDPGAIANAVISLMKMSASERIRMGSAGRDFVQQNHDYAVLARRFAGLMTGGEVTA
jgi:glycosyltransferase involved in cell wall biosynthesis